MKSCPFCLSKGRVQRMRGASGDLMFTIGCINEACLAVGPLGCTEAEAERKWGARNLNIPTKRPKAEGS